MQRVVFKTCFPFYTLRDNLVLTKSGPVEFRFRLSGVQLSDRGYYWCDITAWTKQQPGQAWTKATSAESNKIRIDFQENGGSERRLGFFTVSVTSRRASVIRDVMMAGLKCRSGGFLEFTY